MRRGLLSGGRQHPHTEGERLNWHESSEKVAGKVGLRSAGGFHLTSLLGRAESEKSSGTRVACPAAGFGGFPLRQTLVGAAVGAHGPLDNDVVGRDGKRLLRHIYPGHCMTGRQARRNLRLEEGEECPEPVGQGSRNGQGLGRS